jgi:hypothetical protein
MTTMRERIGFLRATPVATVEELCDPCRMQETERQYLILSSDCRRGYCSPILSQDF